MTRDRHWRRVQTVARPALRNLVTGDADSPTDAVDAVDPSLGRAVRADASWLVDVLEERASDDGTADFAEVSR